MFSGVFSSGCTVDLQIDDSRERKSCYVNYADKREKLKIFSNDEDITGVAKITISPAGKLEHFGIRVELIGELHILKDRGPPYCFFSVSKDLEPPGCLYESQVYNWKFQGAEKEYETYRGENVWLRYYVRLAVICHYSLTQSKQMDIIVQNPISCLPPCKPIKMEVGIEECLHIEFEYDRSCYDLADVVKGKVHFLLVRIKLKSMQVDLVKTELVKGACQCYTTTRTLGKYEIMDGSPAKSETIPVRLHLGAYCLTPTYINLQNKFTVKYYLSIVLVDEEDRRYFKRHDITLCRLIHPPVPPIPQVAVTKLPPSASPDSN